MIKKKTWKVELKARDRLILRDLYYSKGLNLKILHYRYFKDKTGIAAIQRLNRLYDGKYLTKSALADRSKNQILYTILPKGFIEIKDLLPGKVIRKEFQSSNPRHDIELAKIHDRMLLANDLTELKMENEIQSIDFGINDPIYEPFRRLNTDIYFSFLGNNKEYKVAIEYERTSKELKRWQEYLLNYHFEESVNLVLYIAAGPEIKKTLVKIESELAKNFSAKIFFCTLDEFYSSKESTTFVNPNGKTFTMIFNGENS